MANKASPLSTLPPAVDPTKRKVTLGHFYPKPWATSIE